MSGLPSEESRCWARPAVAFRRGERSQRQAAFRPASPPAHRAMQQARQAQPSAACLTQVQQALEAELPAGPGACGDRQRLGAGRSAGRGRQLPLGGTVTTGVQLGGCPPRKGPAGVPPGGFAPGPPERPIGGNGLTWRLAGSGNTDRDRSGRLYGGYVARQRRRPRRRRPKGGRPAGATPSRW